MRLLLRANSHRSAPDGTVEIAASPDTPRRERWEWHLRLSDSTNDVRAGTTTAAVKLDRRDGPAVLTLTSDPAVVLPQAGLLDLPAELTRTERELVLLVVGSGTVRAEGRHLLSELDALVLAGDDPLQIELEQASADAASVALIRLEPAGAASIGWVP